ncbi:hypothetical protein AAFF_G00314910 [Aldrovandia affinis]|uniref:C-type lectin domain-containing protein n=1 Tax=Aldrovandia affinis TaxID=143900 RepID=A0AAD7R9U5_9TELE|nr:hypothetical protein AAFF_G00314910 [Aldrovandia affinis]
MEHSVYLLLLFSGLFTLCSCLSPKYHFVDMHKNWTEAQSYCREHHTDLATVDNPEEMKRMMAVVGSDNVDNWAWIGLEEETSSKWQWSLTDRGFYSQGETEFRNWGDNQPDNGGGNEHCAEMQSNGMWNDQSCDHAKSFICYNGPALGEQEGSERLHSSRVAGPALLLCSGFLVLAQCGGYVLPELGPREPSLGVWAHRGSRIWSGATVGQPAGD